MSQRILTEVVRGQAAIDGAGVHLQRVLGLRTTKSFDPFLMLDGFDSKNPNDYIKGFPWHPHRGIETITYLLKGKMEHGDSLKNKGLITDGSCQWMTAGSGIIHQEMPLESEHMLGAQLWLNIPQKHKMDPPKYADIQAQSIPKIQEEQATIAILSGRYKGQKGATNGSYFDVQYLDIELQADSEWHYNETPNQDTLFLYLIQGDLALDSDFKNFESKACALLTKAQSSPSEPNDTLSVKAGPNGARFFLLSAKPLHEPIAWGGPVVMNTKEELDLAFAEIQNNTFIKHP